MLVAVTQRVDEPAGRQERRDALDRAWYRLLASCGLVGIAVPNDRALAMDLWRRLPFGGLLLTGGNDLAACGGNAPERDETEDALLQAARRRGCPILGVCRGMQIVQSAFGLALRETPGHVLSHQEICCGGRQAAVNSYHVFGTSETVSELVVWARARDGVVKAVRHSTEPIVGVMWHPERLDPFRDEDIRLFCEHFRGGGR